MRPQEELKAAGSWTVSRAMDPLERLGLNTYVGYMHRSFSKK